MTTLSTQPYKGTRDFYPEEMRFRRWMFGKLREAVGRFCYQEYDGPMLESFDLYAAKTGEEIVNQQLYWMMDRGDRKIAVRPEMTPTLARMVAAQVNELPRPVRWFSIPNLWRYERPQRGRLREHWQLNVDVLGGDPLLADAEILQVAYELIRAFGGEKHISIRVNNRRLMDYIFKDVLKLSAEVALGTTKALDSRAKMGEEAYAKQLAELGVSVEQRDAMERFFQSSFESVAKEYPCRGSEELSQLFELMHQSGLGDCVTFDATVLRGMDYYTGTVFEIYDVSPENRRALFGGGRYDDLLSLFGKTPLSGVGFGMGDVGLQNFLEVHALLPELASSIDVFVSLPKIELRADSEKIAVQLRERGLRVMTPLGAAGFGAQLKLASKHQARFAVLFGDSEWAEKKVLLKDLASGVQTTILVNDLPQQICTLL